MVLRESESGGPLKSTLKRIHYLEHRRRSESVERIYASGAHERILAKINAMADPRRGNPNMEPAYQPTLAEVKERIRQAVSNCPV
jgi:hypothetical protein